MFTSYRGGGLGNHQGGGVGHISGMGQVSLYGHEQLIVSTVDHDVSQEEVVGQLSSGHHSVKIEEEEVRIISHHPSLKMKLSLDMKTRSHKNNLNVSNQRWSWMMMTMMS